MRFEIVVNFFNIRFFDFVARKVVNAFLSFFLGVSRVVLILVSLVVRLAVDLLVILARMFSFVVLNLLLFTALISKLLGFTFLKFRFEMNSVSIYLAFVTFLTALALIILLPGIVLLTRFATVVVLLNLTLKSKLFLNLNFTSLRLNSVWFESFWYFFLSGITLDFTLETFFFRGSA